MDIQFSNEKRAPVFFFKGMKCPTQLCRDYFKNHEIKAPIKQPVFNGMSRTGVGAIFVCRWTRKAFEAVEALNNYDKVLITNYTP